MSLAVAKFMELKTGKSIRVLMDRARANTKKYPQEEVEEAIVQAVSEVRKSKRE